MDYTIDLGNRHKTFHINLLKRYIRRVENTENCHQANAMITESEITQSEQIFELVCTAVVEESDCEVEQEIDNGI